MKHHLLCLVSNKPAWLSGWCLWLAVSWTCAAEVDPVLQQNWRFNASASLPEGEEKPLVVRACTQCHDLGGLKGYQGYWTLQQWQAMVADMVKNGAGLNPDEARQVAGYLTRHFGVDGRQDNR